MDRISGANSVLVNGKRMFQDRNAQAGVLAGTFFNALWCNGVQESILAVVGAGGLTPTDSDNTQLLQAVQKIAQRGLYVYSTVGAFNFVPPVGWDDAHAIIIGGGGGGGSGNGYAGYGGGASGFSWYYFPIAAGVTSMPGYVGAGGASDAAGGTSAFLGVNATGGGAGGKGASSPYTGFGAGGQGLSGTLNLFGTLGGAPFGNGTAGAGASGFFGGGSPGGLSGGQTGAGAVAPGSGGGGGSNNNAGGPGGPGIVLIWR